MPWKDIGPFLRQLFIRDGSHLFVGWALDLFRPSLVTKCLWKDCWWDEKSFGTARALGLGRPPRGGGKGGQWPLWCPADSVDEIARQIDPWKRRNKKYILPPHACILWPAWLPIVGATNIWQMDCLRRAHRSACYCERVSQWVSHKTGPAARLTCSALLKKDYFCPKSTKWRTPRIFFPRFRGVFEIGSS